ncbi:MAG: DUF2178 domain-containing protein [Patescibacteria group bacterium]
MSLKQFQTLKMVSAIIVGILVGYSITVENYLIPLISVTVLSVILFWARGRVKEVIADERDYETGGHAARWAIQIFSWVAIVTMFVLLYEKALNPVFEVVAYVLAYSVCGLMLLYSLLFRYYNRIRLMPTKTYYLVVGVVIILAFILMGLRFFSGEDDWVCQNGQWVEHGHPDAPMPTAVCQQ